MDVQKPEILAKLRTLDVGQRPAGGWKAFLGDTGKGAGAGAGTGTGTGTGTGSGTGTSKGSGSAA
jgi:hypothetical protein